MSRMESITGNTEVIESTPITMNAMNIVESIDVISASERMFSFRVGMKILPSSNAIVIDKICGLKANAKKLEMNT